MASFLKRDLAANRRLKAKLREGNVATMIHSSHPSPSLVEKLGECGFDAVLIDCEHGSAGPERVEEMARAASLAGIVSIVRPEDAMPWMVTRYLECGVDGLIMSRRPPSSAPPTNRKSTGPRDRGADGSARQSPRRLAMRLPPPPLS